MAFRFTQLAIPDVIQIEGEVFADERGFFAELYRGSTFKQHGIASDFVQDNHSRSRRWVLRGLHYQKQPRAQAKLVAVLRGEIYDVAVDIRRGSPNYGRWVGAVLSEENRRALYIPEGFAHGFCVLSDEADVVYKVTREYAPELDRGIVWNDPELGIEWPVSDPVLSEKDAALPRLTDGDNNFVYGESR
jgi:dTDP-4-dehydrorhamnose 3,5-epimerase